MSFSSKAVLLRCSVACLVTSLTALAACSADAVGGGGDDGRADSTSDAGSTSDAAVQPAETGTQACVNMRCEAPPKTACIDAKTLRTFAAKGTCEKDVCNYEHTDAVCMNGCKDGACIGSDPCNGVVCNSPPASVCTSASTQQTYAASGTCSGGKCSYATGPINTCACRAGACGSLGPATSITAKAKDHVCVTTAKGVSCWGSNDLGQLGNQPAKVVYVPVDLPFPVSNMVSTGWTSTCVVTAAGGVQCLGDNAFGGLGNGTTTSSLVPVDVSGLTSGVAKVTVGSGYACALTTAGGVKCWGHNNNAMLGNNTYTNSSVPVDVAGLTSGVIAVSAHFAHTCAIVSGGGVKCWGDNTFGKLGTGTAGAATAQDVVGLASGAADVTTSNQNTCVVMSGGGVKCWGWNQHGQVGTGSASQSVSTPADVVGLSDVVQVSAGVVNVCAVTSVGNVYCWGHNGYKQLGNNSNVAISASPVQVQGLGGAADAVATGEYFACAHLKSGGVKCWGRNAFGNLGNNTAGDTAVPTAVLGLP